MNQGLQHGCFYSWGATRPYIIVDSKTGRQPHHHIVQGVWLGHGPPRFGVDANLQQLTTQLLVDQGRLSDAKLNLTQVVPRELAEVEAMRVVAGLNEFAPGLMSMSTAMGGVASGTLGNYAGRDISSKLRRFGELAAWQAQSISEGHSARANITRALNVAAQDLKKTLGPLEHRVFKGGVDEALYFPAAKGVQGEWINLSAASTLKRLARVSTFGTAFFLAVDIYKARNEIAAAKQEDKVKVAYEQIGGIFSGLISGGAVTLGVVALAGPLGWTAALALGVAGSMGVGKFGEGIAGLMHAHGGDFLSLENGQLINRWCK